MRENALKLCYDFQNYDDEMTTKLCKDFRILDQVEALSIQYMTRQIENRLRDGFENAQGFQKL